ncbi:hypothetical protein PVK06_028012 [Gossypium arboreum]|uniref:Uncharacterized protein n=1 Tax=Gossypium arboreum TaxID=29729 RepID=A0ABR0P3Z9_GOSAR|nr:hypothetical protein PVK06_028012 [Gossypium arboreum]
MEKPNHPMDFESIGFELSTFFLLESGCKVVWGGFFFLLDNEYGVIMVCVTSFSSINDPLLVPCHMRPLWESDNGLQEELGVWWVRPPELWGWPTACLEPGV